MSTVAVSYDSDSNSEKSNELVRTSDSENSEAAASEVEASLDEDSDYNENSKENGEGNLGWADALSKLLHRKAPEKVILSKGQTDKEIRKRKAMKLAEEKGEKFTDEDDVKRRKEEHQQTLFEWRRMAYVKPDVLQKPYERDLQKIAMRGVVQLFNAVQKQQKTVSEKLKSGKTEAQKDRAIQSMKKGDFLDMLKVNGKQKKKVTDESDSGSVKQPWLADDYMMQAAMKDWDNEQGFSDHDDNEESS